MMRALLVLVLSVSASAASAFGEKGSTVGRLLMGPDANAAGRQTTKSPHADAGSVRDESDDDEDDGDDRSSDRSAGRQGSQDGESELPASPLGTPRAKGSPASREALTKLMMKPTEPHFDPLLPLSGRWVRCQPAAATDNGAASIQDRFTSSDRSHFSHTILKDSDAACKKPVSETRTNYECEAAGKTALSCKVLKTEARTGEAAWTETKATDGDHSLKSLKLSFTGIEPAHKRSRKKSATSDDLRHLDVRLVPDAGGEPETFHLDFVPATPHAHKHAAATAGEP